jgi:hypothetical protein
LAAAHAAIKYRESRKVRPQTRRRSAGTKPASRSHRPVGKKTRRARQR